LTAQNIHQKKTRLTDRTDRAWFSHFLRHPEQETERVYSYNPGARTGHETLAASAMASS